MPEKNVGFSQWGIFSVNQKATLVCALKDQSEEEYHALPGLDVDIRLQTCHSKLQQTLRVIKWAGFKRKLNELHKSTALLV
jgi:hypothetical protein